MVQVVVDISKYLLLILLILYGINCFRAMNRFGRQKKKAKLTSQYFLIFMFHSIGFAVLVLDTMDGKLAFLYLVEVAYLIAMIVIMKILYPKMAKALFQNMLMLMSVGFVMLARLAPGKAERQFMIICVASIITFFIPFLMRKMLFLKNLSWVYAVAGIVLLMAVFIIGQASRGAKLSFEIFGIGIQPSEFVKILYVFFVASVLTKCTDMFNLLQVSIFAAIHVLILVLSRDLGSALIFFIVYACMIYVATKKWYYFAGIMLMGVVAAALAGTFFSHVQNRVIAWQDPFSVIEGSGYQIAQSLFAIGTGGWFGLGLGQGAPLSIPFVEEDIAISAICEELGLLSALLILLIMLSCFVLFVMTSMRMKDTFYKYVALGLAVTYIFQVFLTVGGAFKFIPLTGVTLPLISYGGSSVLSTMIIFGVIQGIYMLQNAVTEDTAYLEEENDALEYEEDDDSDFEIHDMEDLIMKNTHFD